MLRIIVFIFWMLLSQSCMCIRHVSLEHKNMRHLSISAEIRKCPIYLTFYTRRMNGIGKEREMSKNESR